MRFVRSARAKGAFVHFALSAKRAVSGKLRRAKRTSEEAVAATNAFVFVVKHDSVAANIKTIDGANPRARRVRAMHTGDADTRFFANYAFVDRNDPPTINADGDFVSLFACDYATVAINASPFVAVKLHSSHCRLLTLFLCEQACIWFRGSL
jgi:hypothetical protein